MSLEKAAQSESASSEGVGLGMGLMMPAMFSQYLSGSRTEASQAVCQECQNSIQPSAKFCPHCGHQQLVFSQCLHCSKNLTPNAKFCSRCGHPVGEKPAPKICPNCTSGNLTESKFCNHCGEKL
jgi:rRNA maturation endonuclease Nob1